MTDQYSLFPEDTAEVLRRLKLTLEEATCWHCRGWLSFNPEVTPELQPFQVHELTFITALAKSWLREPQVWAILSALEKPYAYDVTHAVYHLRHGWIEYPRPEHVRRADVLAWIDWAEPLGNAEAVATVAEYATEAASRLRAGGGNKA